MIALPSAVLGAMTAPLKLLRTYPWQAGCALLALYGWWQHERASDWHERTELEASNHARTKAEYRDAQAQAAARAKAARIETEQRYSALARKADDANETADLWRARAQRFADAGGLRSASGSCSGGAPSEPGTSPDNHLATRGDAAGSASVTLSRDDFDTLTQNTERLLKVHAWGEALMAQGLAIASEK